MKDALEFKVKMSAQKNAPTAVEAVLKISSFLEQHLRIHDDLLYWF